MNTAKPSVTAAEAGQLIKDTCGIQAEQLTALEGGNLSKVFSFQAEGRQYVIRFNEMEDAYHTEAYIADLLSSQGIPFPAVYAQGLHKTYSYCISERISGHTLSELDTGGRKLLLPELLRVIAAMNNVRLSDHSSGYGFINAEGNGSHQSWDEFIRAFYAKEQQGYWSDWQELFNTSCLEREVFDECYGRLLGFSKYNAPHRYFVHNDCHEWNILTRGRSITGIIDSNGIYGDFMIDIATIARGDSRCGYGGSLPGVL